MGKAEVSRFQTEANWIVVSVSRGLDNSKSRLFTFLIPLIQNNFNNYSKLTFQTEPFQTFINFGNYCRKSNLRSRVQPRISEKAFLQFWWYVRFSRLRRRTISLALLERRRAVNNFKHAAPGLVINCGGEIYVSINAIATGSEWGASVIKSWLRSEEESSSRPKGERESYSLSLRARLTFNGT